MIKKIKKIIKSEEFLKEVAKEGLLTQKLTSNVYGDKVKNLCNNACAYMCNKLLDNLEIEELSKFEFHNGYFGKKQHSWLEYNFNKKKKIIIDLTYAQFDKTSSELYFCFKNKNFITKNYVKLNEFEKLSIFFKEL